MERFLVILLVMAGSFCVYVIVNFCNFSIDNPLKFVIFAFTNFVNNFNKCNH